MYYILVNIILINLTYLLLPFILLCCLCNPFFSFFVTICTSFTEVSSVLLRILHSFLKMYSGSPAGDHFQRNIFHLVFCIIVFVLPMPAFSFFFWLLMFEREENEPVSDSPTDRVCRFYLVLLIGHLGNDWIFLALQLESRLMIMDLGPISRI